MAKLKMNTVTIVALQKDRKYLLEHLQDSSLIEITCTDAAEEGFRKIDLTSQQQMFERYGASASKALKILDDIAPEKKSLLSSFSGRREVDPDEIGEIADTAAETMEICNDIISYDRLRVYNAAEKIRIKTVLSQLEPWKGLDIDISEKETQSTAVIIGSLPKLCSEVQLAELLAQDESLVFDFEIIYSSNEITCFVLFTQKDKRAQAEAILRSAGFSYPSVQCDSKPSEEIESLNQKLAELDSESKNAEDKIAAYADKRRDIENVCDYFVVRADKYSVLSGLDQTEHAFVINGYIPEIDREKLDRICSKIEPCIVEYAEAPEDAPVKLKNNAFAEPAQGIVTMYASPGPDDIDPSPVLAFFYYFFFGMMFSDAGYGLLMTLVTAILIRKCKPETSMKNNLRLFEFCGISTFIWGLIYGSIFGDAPAVFYNHFAGTSLTMKDILPWPILDQKHDAMFILIMSIAFGLIHILAGMCCKFYVLWKKGDKTGAVCDVGSWMILLIGIAVGAAGIKFGDVVKYTGFGLAGAGVLMLLLTQGRDKKNPVMKVLSGFISLYDITSYVSDLLSYSRLLALGLTTGVMAEVFNLLAELLGKSVIGIIPMTLVFLLGHVINIGLNALGSYVHTMRLQYVEMFSKFYEGGGKQFEPFTLNSKYIRIKEENKK